MAVYSIRLTVPTRGQGMYEVTDLVAGALRKSGLKEGGVTVFCQHTSCSLVIMENADPTALEDLRYFFDGLVPEGNPCFRHTMEGPDDMPSHIKMALTRTSEVIPFMEGCLCLGTWQGIFLWEHRRRGYQRRLVLSFQGE